MRLQIEKIRCDSIEFDRSSLRILIESIVELAKTAKLKQLEDRFSLHLPWLFRVPLFPRFGSLVPRVDAGARRRNRASLDSQHAPGQPIVYRPGQQADPRGFGQPAKTCREIRVETREIHVETRGNRFEIAKWKTIEGHGIRIEFEQIALRRAEKRRQRSHSLQIHRNRSAVDKRLSMHR